MSIILEQLALLFMFMALGYLLTKKGLIKPEHSKILSTLGMYLYSPGVVLRSFARNFNVANITRYYPLIIAGAAIVIVSMVIARFGARFFARDGYNRKVYEYTIITPNYGYMGYALAEGIFGPEALLSMILFAVPYYLYAYTLGYCSLTNKPTKFKQLMNPVMVCLLIGAVIGVTGIKLPGIATSFLDKAAACMAPSGMIITGIAIAEFDFRELITDIKVYIMSFIRLLLIPFLALIILRPIAPIDVTRSAVLLLAMPCGLNTILLPKLVGADCKTGAKLAFISNILALATIPLILGQLN